MPPVPGNRVDESNGTEPKQLSFRPWSPNKEQKDILYSPESWEHFRVLIFQMFSSNLNVLFSVVNNERRIQFTSAVRGWGQKAEITHRNLKQLRGTFISFSLWGEVMYFPVARRWPRKTNLNSISVPCHRQSIFFPQAVRRLNSFSALFNGKIFKCYYFSGLDKSESIPVGGIKNNYNNCVETANLLADGLICLCKPYESASALMGHYGVLEKKFKLQIYTLTG